MNKTEKTSLAKKRNLKAYFRKSWLLYVFLLPFLAGIVIFKYYPMFGIQLAFKDWDAWGGIWGSPWATTDGKLDVFKHFVFIFNDEEFLTKLVNTVRISVLKLLFGFPIPILLTIFMNEMLAAYSLSKKDLWGRKVIMLIIIFSMLFSGGLIPYYLLIAKTLKLTDNFLVYILPDLANGYNTIIAINFIRGLPDGVEEAASIDGANYWQIFTRIIMPLSFPIMATIGLWVGVGKWNSWYATTLFIRDRDLITFQNYLQSILSSATGGNGSVGQIESESAKMAAIVIGVLPIVAIYPFVQKHFVKGTLLGSVKE